jgi:L-lactate dehydrogenase
MSSGNTERISRIAIVGVGQVGGAAAYALILSSVASELLLVDSKAGLRDGQVRDLSDVAYPLDRQELASASKGNPYLHTLIRS